MTEIDPNSILNIEDIEIDRVGWLDGSMFVRFPEPTDIVIIDTEEFIENPLRSDDEPIREIIISDLRNYEPPLHTDS